MGFALEKAARLSLPGALVGAVPHRCVNVLRCWERPGEVAIHMDAAKPHLCHLTWTWGASSVWSEW